MKQMTKFSLRWLIPCALVFCQLAASAFAGPADKTMKFAGFTLKKHIDANNPEVQERLGLSVEEGLFSQKSNLRGYTCSKPSSPPPLDQIENVSISVTKDTSQIMGISVKGIASKTNLRWVGDYLKGFQRLPNVTVSTNSEESTTVVTYKRVLQTGEERLIRAEYTPREDGKTDIFIMNFFVKMDTVKPPFKPAPLAVKKEAAVAQGLESFLGIKFGTDISKYSEKSKFTFEKDRQDEGLVYRFTPKSPFRKYDEYRVKVTPFSKKVYMIMADVAHKEERGVDVRRETEDVRTIVKMKYGVKEVDDVHGWRYYLLSNRDIYLDHYNLHFGATDRDLEKLAREEWKGIDQYKKKKHAKSLESDIDKL